MVILYINYTYIDIIFHQSNTVSLIESMMVLRPRQGNLRQVFRLFSLVRGFPGHPPSLIRVLAVRMKKGWVLSIAYNSGTSVQRQKAKLSTRSG